MAKLGEMKIETGRVARSCNIVRINFSVPISSHGFAYLADMSIRIQELNTELELVTDFDAPGVSVLQAPSQSLGQIQMTRKLISLCHFIDDFQTAVLIQLMLIVQDGSRTLVCVADGIRVFGVQGKVVAFDELRNDLSNSKSLKERDQLEVHTDASSEDHGLRWCADRVFNLVWPDIFHGLPSVLVKNLPH